MSITNCLLWEHHLSILSKKSVVGKKTGIEKIEIIFGVYQFIICDRWWVSAGSIYLNLYFAILHKISEIRSFENTQDRQKITALNILKKEYLFIYGEIHNDEIFLYIKDAKDVFLPLIDKKVLHEHLLYSLTDIVVSYMI